MHLEVLVEDQSGAIVIEALLQKIIGSIEPAHTYRIHLYKGIGRIPKDLRGQTDPQKRILLDRLPQLLQGYGRSLQRNDAVLVVVDLDRRDCLQFKREMVSILERCHPSPKTLFRIAIEEIEAWLLGDQVALKMAYPRAKQSVLNTYSQDSICGTWEKMADVVYPGGSVKLKPLGYPLIGQVKCDWARNISQYLDVNSNNSKSFQVFCTGVQQLSGVAPQL
jgi:hypothetical protein